MVRLKRTLALLPGGGSDVRLRATELMARKNLLNVTMTSILRRCHRLSSLNTAGGAAASVSEEGKEKGESSHRIIDGFFQKQRHKMAFHSFSSSSMSMHDTEQLQLDHFNQEKFVINIICKIHNYFLLLPNYSIAW